MSPDKPSELVPSDRVCANCGEPLHGAYCYHCGQSVKSLIRHLSALAEDALDLVFNIDSRILRTLPALFLRPGYLTIEYFAGRRTRYITPFRLMFFLSVLAFLVIQLTINLGSTHLNVEGGASEFGSAKTPEQVQQMLDGQLSGIAKARSAAPAAAAGLDRAARQLRKAAALRVEQLKHKDAAPGGPASAASAWTQRIASATNLEQVQSVAGEALAAIGSERTGEGAPSTARAKLDRQRRAIYYAAGERVEALRQQQRSDLQDTHLFGDHVDIGWLPAGLNARINDSLQHMRSNFAAAVHDEPGARERVKVAFFNMLPQTMFVLLPLFAVLLKIVYLFKRRLYMEHLMVALHSHAFIFLTLLLLAVLSLAKSALPAWAASPLGWLQAALWIWLPIYLLLMQKRVYRQGWFMTLTKYGVLGLCYTVLVSITASVAGLLSLAG